MPMFTATTPDDGGCTGSVTALPVVTYRQG